MIPAIRTGCACVPHTLRRCATPAPPTRPPSPPVEEISAPLLLLSGSDDQVWPSDQMADALLRRRRAVDVGATDHHQHYTGGGHLLRLGCLPTDVTRTGGIDLGGTREGIAAAQVDATARVLDFFRTTVGS